MQLFDCEHAHLFVLKLKDMIDSKFSDVYDVLYQNSSDLQSKFQEQSWEAAMTKVRSRSASYYSSALHKPELKRIYKSLLTFYLRSVLKSSEIKAPRVNYLIQHIMKQFGTAMKQQPDYFASFGYADQVVFIQSMLRKALYELVALKQEKRAFHSSRTEAQSIGPDDSVSVASLSRLTPGKQPIPRLRNASKLSRHSLKSARSSRQPYEPVAEEELEGGDDSGEELVEVPEPESAESQNEQVDEQVDENVSDIRVVSLSA